MATGSICLLVFSVVLYSTSCEGVGQFGTGTQSFQSNLDVQRSKRSDDAGPLEAVVTQLSQEVTSLRADLSAARAEIQNAKGSTFIRWGRSSCPSSSQLVYSGVAGGSWYGDTGGNANRLCLSLQPEFDTTNHHSTVFSKLYGAEYEGISDEQNYEVPCALCRSAQVTTVMIPGTLTCPSGWTVQYRGHLTGNYYNHHGAGEYLCLDSSSEGRGASTNNDGALFYYTVTQCGSLPCPPYINSRVATCVVCSL